ncbi:MAG: response regulator [Phycisphaerae bacterium]|nr:response regulator [Phycisphaerae bacterium]MCZ2400800.1 response regulator [Phycisphaerae bacterium]NUQ49971.1 response regulator [Phycisphaerae bacterium]
MPPRTLRILLVAEDGADAALAGLLSGAGEVRVVSSMAEAAQIAGDDPAIICSPPEAIALACAAEFVPGSVLSQLGQGLCLLDLDARVLWSNQKARSLGPQVLEAVRKRVADRVAEHPPQRWTGPTPQTEQFALSMDRTRHFDVSVSLVQGGGETEPRLLALISDVTRTRALHEKVLAIDQAGRELVGIDADAISRLDIGERLKVLEDKILRFSHDLMHFDHLVIRVLDPRTRRLETVVAGGLSEEAAALEIFASPEGNGISGLVAATGESYICADVAQDPRYLPGLDRARSTLTVPLWLNDQVVGTMNIESEFPSAFNDDDRQIAEIFGRYVAIALHILKLLAVERSTVGGQVAADVRAEVATPLNAIVAEATSLLPVAPPQLAGRLQAIIDQVEVARAALSAAAENAAVTGPRGSFEGGDPALQGKRILVADDEDIIRETVCDVLARAGASVTPARDGQEAVDAAATQRFDLVLSDIKMPHHNGYEVFAAVRQASPLCPVILITGFGYDPNHSIVRASREGLAGVLFKPFKVDQLLEEVRQALTAARR